MKLRSILLFYFASVNSSFAEKKIYDDSNQKQHSMLRKHRNAVDSESTSNTQIDGSFPERHLKSSKKKGSKTSKGTKISKSPTNRSRPKRKKRNSQTIKQAALLPSKAPTNQSQSNGTKRHSPMIKQNTTMPSEAPTLSVTPSFAPTSSVVPSVPPTSAVVPFLQKAISSVVENNDFSSYNQEDFDAAKTWFLNPSNHPSDFRENGDEYMKERFILALIYSANCKEDCILVDKWLSANDHCKWIGVHCSFSTMEVNRLFDPIDFIQFGLSGEFTMFGMKSLEKIDLMGNNLSGTFTVAGASPNLTSLYLYGYLGENKFTGFHHKFTGFFGGGVLTNPEDLNLDHNVIEGDVIANDENVPTSIKYMNLRFNKLTGFVGGGKLTKLETLQLAGNEFVGDFIANDENVPTSIKNLNLSGNKLTGFVGGGKLTKLETLDLDKNEFVGDFTVNEKNVPTSIKNLNLSSNKLTGFVGGGKLTKLGSLDLGNNEITGDFMITAENVPTSLWSLSLSGNKLTGFVGGGKLTKLGSLDLGNNEITGDFMITAENLPTSLLSLSLSGNKLTSIDAESSAVPKLHRLDVNGIEGITVKEELCKRVPELVQEPNSPYFTIALPVNNFEKQEFSLLMIYPSNVCA